MVVARAAVGSLDPLGPARTTDLGVLAPPGQDVHRPPTENSMVFRSPLPPVIVPETTITGFVLAAVAAHPDKPALVDGPTGRTLTYAELDRAIRSLAGGLVARGFQRGQVVALVARTAPSSPWRCTGSRSRAASSPRSTRRTRSTRCSVSSPTPARRR